MTISRAHEIELCAGLSEADRRRLIELLTRVAAEQGLAAGGHPRLGEPPQPQPR
jgi:hypothetical protein